MPSHDWMPSTLNHGEQQCRRCLMTNREAWVLGDDCPVPVKVETPVNDNTAEPTDD